MDLTKFLANVAQRRQPSMIRKFAEISMLNPNLTNLASGMPNAGTFPFEEISFTLKDGTKKILREKDLMTLLQYGPSQGFAPLVKKWREFQKTQHSPKNDNWDVLITNGSQDGCSKVFELFLNENDAAMLQTPTFSGTINALTALAPEIIGIAQDGKGILPEMIEKICTVRLRSGKSMPKILYVNPTGANPTGTVLPEYRKKAIYALARKYNFIIIEDDPYYFLHFLEELPKTFLSLDEDGRVIRLDSFSKIISAGVRLGTVTANKDICRKLILHMESSNIHTSSLSQVVIYKLLDTWGSERLAEHFEYIQEFYRRRRDTMLLAVEKHLKGLADWTIPTAGMFLWVHVKGVDDVLVMVKQKCVPRGVLVLPGCAFNYDQSKPDCHLRLSYSYADPGDIDQAVSIIASAIREEISKTKKGYHHC